ncbi:MAG: hypothetical protein ACTSU5_08355 [Promethearchaeota archaeon]
MVIKIRYNCKLCGTTVTFEVTDEMQAEVLKEASYFPYPVIHVHGEDSVAGKHAAVLHFDENFRNRGTEATQFIY